MRVILQNVFSIKNSEICFRNLPQICEAIGGKQHLSFANGKSQRRNQLRYKIPVDYQAKFVEANTPLVLLLEGGAYLLGLTILLSRRAAAQLGRAELLAKGQYTDRLQNPAKLRRFRIGGGIGAG